MTIQQDLQKDAIPSGLIELYVVDLNPIGAAVVFYLTPNTYNGGPITFDGHEYTPFPMFSSGWDKAIDGKQPRPTLQIANATQFIQSYLNTYQDLVGAKVTRMLTLEKYCAHGSTPGAQTIATNVFLVHQMSTREKDRVEFVLTTLIDRPGKKFPPGQVLRSEFPGAGLIRKS